MQPKSTYIMPDTYLALERQAEVKHEYYAGAGSGAMDGIALQTMQRVATAEVGKQASEIAFWKMEE